MSFHLKFLDETVPQDWSELPGREVLVEIKIGDFSERMATPLGYWTTDQYKKQWKHAADTLLENETNSTLFITQFYDPKEDGPGYVLECWWAYREADKVYMRNSYIVSEGMPKEWDLVSLDSLATSRNPKDMVSEWVVSVEDIKLFRTALQTL